MTGKPLYNYWGYSTVGFFAPKAGYAATGTLRDAGGRTEDARQGAARARHRGHARRRLQPHRRGQRARPDDLLPRPRQPDLLHAHAGGLLLQLLRHRQHAELQQPDRAQHGARLPALLGERVSHRRLPLRPRRDPRPRPERRAARQPAAAGIARLRPDPRQVQADRRGVGRGRAVPGRLLPRLWAVGGVERQVPRHACAAGSRAMRASSAMSPRASPGSPDLYPTRGPTASINFITAHDGFTLHDLVSYNEKHNEANGENNNDGANDNDSWNCGVEGRDRRPGDQRAAPPPDEERHRHPPGQPGRADDPDGRRSRAHPVRQQQHLLPRRRAELVRLGAGRAGTPSCCASPSTASPSGRRTPSCAATATSPGATRLAPAIPTSAGTAPQAWAAGLVGGEPHPGLHALRAARRARRLARQLPLCRAQYPLRRAPFALPALPDGLAWHVAINTGAPSPEDSWEIGDEPVLADQGAFLLGGRSVAALVGR